ncbi:cold shock domain-containing protein [Vibrio campbellii]|uniref:cold shock domain-containing protein n=1 Tax=Vibrio campbellii TaxID=680 RepID=UPI001D17A0D2|nr:cold shock domain-containing protein [Vibrio campbellii]MCC4222819.1 cold shock domain-containing protein [Vibrio campbellii]
MEKEIGKINAYNDFKGIGFIRREKGKDLYFSIDDFAEYIDLDALKVGLNLKFDVVKTPKGPRAVAIELFEC